MVKNPNRAIRDVVAIRDRVDRGIDVRVAVLPRVRATTRAYDGPAALTRPVEFAVCDAVEEECDVDVNR